MNVALRVPAMTREQLLDRAAAQEAPHEFDGFDPVAMTGGTRRHGVPCGNLLVALRTRLRDSSFERLPEAGLATTGETVRYPDATILPVDQISRGVRFEEASA